MKISIPITVLATLVCGGALWRVIASPPPILLYNKSDSAPQGWYIVDYRRPIDKGTMVVAFAPTEARKLADERGYLPYHIPLIKTVWSIGGEEICVENDVIRAPNRPDIQRATQDGIGRDLPSWHGCITLQPDEVFLVSTDVQTSFDSRYFGAVPVENVIGVVRLIGEDDR